MPEGFTAVNIGQVNFDEGDGDRSQRISNRDTCMGERSRIDDDERNTG